MTDFHKPRLAAFGLLAVSFLGMSSHSKSRPSLKSLLITIVLGAVLYFAAPLAFYADWSSRVIASTYIVATIFGYTLFWIGGNLIVALRHNPARSDIFNSFNGSFPQEQRLIRDDFSTNLPTR